MMAEKSELQIRFNNLDQIREDMRSKAGLVIRKAALDIEAQAKANAPVDTGALKNSIIATKDPSKPFTWQVAVGVEYGPFVEYGTTKMVAQPFLTPAVEAVRPALLAALESMIDD